MINIKEHEIETDGRWIYVDGGVDSNDGRIEEVDLKVTFTAPMTVNSRVKITHEDAIEIVKEMFEKDRIDHDVFNNRSTDMEYTIE